MSVDMAVDIEGLPELEAKLNRLDDNMKLDVHQALQFEARAMKNIAWAHCPVRTGRLRNSIFGRVRDWLLELGATAPYAVYVEFGTRYMQARHFLSDAVQSHMPQVIASMNQAIRQAIGEASR